jgi:hypothetical protein
MQQQRPFSLLVVCSANLVDIIARHNCLNWPVGGFKFFFWHPKFFCPLPVGRSNISMSQFAEKVICERVKFYSHHIDPRDEGVPGVLTLACGHTAEMPSVPAQQFNFTVSPEDGSLTLTGQAGGPSPAVDAMAVASNGTVNFPVGLQVNGQPVNPGSAPVSNPPVARQWAQLAVAQVNLGNNASPGTIYAFDTSAFAGKSVLTVTIDKISVGTLSTASSGAVYVAYYLSDTLNGAYNPAKSSLLYATPSILNGNSVAANSLSFLYASSIPPGGLYLNAYCQSSGGWGCVLNTVKFNAAIVAS